MALQTFNCGALRMLAGPSFAACTPSLSRTYASSGIAGGTLDTLRDAAEKARQAAMNAAQKIKATVVSATNNVEGTTGPGVAAKAKGAVKTAYGSAAHVASSGASVVGDVTRGTADAVKEAAASGQRVVGGMGTKVKETFNNVTDKQQHFEERPPPATEHTIKDRGVKPSVHGELDAESAGLTGPSKARAGAAQHEWTTEPVGGVQPGTSKVPHAGAAQHEHTSAKVPGTGASKGAGPGN